MPQLMVDVITSLDGFSSAEGWPGLWGLGGPEYFAWLAEDAARTSTSLMGATTYRLFAGFVKAGEEDMSALTSMDKIVFSSTLQEPLSWANTRLVADDPVETVRDLKQGNGPSLRTIGSLSLCRSLLVAGLVDRFGYEDSSLATRPWSRRLAAKTSVRARPFGEPVRRV